MLSAIVSVTGRLGPKTAGEGDSEDHHFHIKLGGLTAGLGDVPDEHLGWFQRWEAKPGDRILIEIVESDVAPEPVERRNSDQKSASADERAFYERTKELYFDLKEKFEPEV